MAFDSNKAKEFILSKTVWGVVVMLVAVFSDSLGLKLGDSVDSIVTAIGAILALYGRFTAEGPLSILGFVFNKKEEDSKQ